MNWNMGGGSDGVMGWHFYYKNNKKKKLANGNQIYGLAKIYLMQEALRKTVIDILFSCWREHYVCMK